MRGELIHFPDRYYKSGQACQHFLLGIVFRRISIQTNLQLSNSLGNLAVVMIVIVCIVSQSFRIIGDDAGSEDGGYKVSLKASWWEGRGG